MFALRRAVLASVKLPSAAPAPLLVRHATSEPPPPKNQDDRQGSQGVLSRAAEAISDTAHNMKEKLKEATGAYSDNNRQDSPIDRATNRAWDNTKQTARDTSESIKQTAKDMQEGAMDRGTQAKENLKETAENVKRAVGAGSGSADKPE